MPPKPSLNNNNKALPKLQQSITKSASAAGGASSSTSNKIRQNPTKGKEEKLPLLVPPPSAIKAAEDISEEQKNALKVAAEAETARLAAEEAEKLRLAAEEEQRKKLEEELALKKLMGNGEVKLLYERYDELFPIIDGSTTASAIDEVYCLSFVMPDCVIHLSTLPPAEKYQREAAGELDLFVSENPRGTYHGLVKDLSYYVYVEENADQLRRDQEIAKRNATTLAEAAAKDSLQRDDGRMGMESCSCIYGNPCVDEYGCKDWTNRYAIAQKNGWKGF